MWHPDDRERSQPLCHFIWNNLAGGKSEKGKIHQSCDSHQPKSSTLLFHERRSKLLGEEIGPSMQQRRE